MANNGPDTNGSQFFMTFQPCPWLDEKNVVFGRVKDGWHVLDAIECEGTNNGRPTRSVIISDCGQFPPSKKEFQVKKKISATDITPADDYDEGFISLFKKMN